MKQYFKYKKVTIEQIQQLINKEPLLTKFIDLKNPFTIRIMPDHFQCIVHTIISQQLHSAAVDSIWNKMILNLKKIKPKTFAFASKEILSTIGLSPQKIALLKQISYDILDKKLNLKKLAKKSNEEIGNALINYKYVGQWTIDMILIFTYYRNNILPKTDYGVLKGIKCIYPNQNINDSFLTNLNKKFNDYSTLFTFCMWYINKTIKNTK